MQQHLMCTSLCYEIYTCCSVRSGIIILHKYHGRGIRKHAFAHTFEPKILDYSIPVLKVS